MDEGDGSIYIPDLEMAAALANLEIAIIRAAHRVRGEQLPPASLEITRDPVLTEPVSSDGLSPVLILHAAPFCPLTPCSRAEYKVSLLPRAYKRFPGAGEMGETTHSRAQIGSILKSTEIFSPSSLPRVDAPLVSHPSRAPRVGETRFACLRVENSIKHVPSPGSGSTLSLMTSRLRRPGFSLVQRDTILSASTLRSTLGPGSVPSC